MSQHTIFLITFGIISFVILFLNFKYGMLKDDSAAAIRPYSLARVQLAWWILIIMSCFATIVFGTLVLPTLFQSTLVLLGVAAGTTMTARLIDVSDKTNGKLTNPPSEGFIRDILSDSAGVSIHRLLCVLCNVIIGVWFILVAWKSSTIPDVPDMELGLLGFGSGTYVGMKISENK